MVEIIFLRCSPVSDDASRSLRQAFLGVGDIQLTQDKTTATNKHSGTASASTTTSADPFDLGGTRLQDIPGTRVKSLP